jgi:signal transduction histidine kinase
MTTMRARAATGAAWATTAGAAGLGGRRVRASSAGSSRTWPGRPASPCTRYGSPPTCAARRRPEEERRRLHRDLHDGLGPALAGLALQVDVARGLVRTDPAAAESLLADVKAQ